MQELYDITKLLQLIWAWKPSLKAVSVEIRAENSPHCSLCHCFLCLLISADNWLVSISYPAVRKEAQRHQTDNKELLRSPMSWSKTCTWTYCKDDQWLRENNSPYNQAAVFCSRHSQSDRGRLQTEDKQTVVTIKQQFFTPLLLI